MIYSSSSQERVAWNLAGVLWQGEWIKQEDARRKFLEDKKIHPKRTFWQFIDYMNYRILD
jgi:hypothetical protein